jgi:hypothetical protein
MVRDGGNGNSYGSKSGARRKVLAVARGFFLKMGSLQRNFFVQGKVDEC